MTNGANNSYTYVPNESDWYGTDSFTYKLTDANGNVSNIGTTTINVNQTLIDYNYENSWDPYVGMTEIVSDFNGGYYIYAEYENPGWINVNENLEYVSFNSATTTYDITPPNGDQWTSDRSNVLKEISSNRYIHWSNDNSNGTVEIWNSITNVQSSQNLGFYVGSIRELDNGNFLVSGSDANNFYLKVYNNDLSSAISSYSYDIASTVTGHTVGSQSNAIQTSSGQFFFNSRQGDMFKVDTSGNIMWKLAGAGQIETFINDKIIVATDTGVKGYDTFGNLLWTHRQGSSYEKYYGFTRKQMLEFSDGKSIAYGMTLYKGSACDKETWVFKIDTDDGSVTWSHNVDYPSWNIGYTTFIACGPNFGSESRTSIDISSGNSSSKMSNVGFNLWDISFDSNENIVAVVTASSSERFGGGLIKLDGSNGSKLLPNENTSVILYPYGGGTFEGGY